jgi:hypothetical protein
MAEIYKQNTWVDNETILNADNMNHIEQGIKNNNNEILEIEEKLERDLPESGISGSKIQDGTITEEKLSEDLNDKITNGTRVIFNVLAVADNVSGTNTDDTINITEALNKDTPVSDINNSFIAFKANFTGTENSYITGTLTLTKTVESTTTTVVYNLPNIQLGENEVEINLALTAGDPSSGTLEDFFTANFNDATYSYTISGTIQEYSSGENYTLEISGLAVVEIGKLVDYVKKTDYATAAKPGVGRVSTSFGTQMYLNGQTFGIARATEDQIASGGNNYRPIVPLTQHLSVFYGLAKVAGVDVSNIDYDTALGSYTDEAKAAIQNMIGLGDSSITTNKIADDAVSGEKISDSAITSQKLSTHAVDTDKIANEAVTSDKLASSFYETDTFSMQCSGTPDPNQTFSCSYVKIGKVVILTGYLNFGGGWTDGRDFGTIPDGIKPSRNTPFNWASTSSAQYKGNGYIDTNGILHGDEGPVWSPYESMPTPVQGIYGGAAFTVSYII